MTDISQQASNPEPRRLPSRNKGRLETGLGLLVLSGLALLVVLIASGAIAPDVSVLGKMSLAVKIHAGSAIAALVLGAAQFVLPKGRRMLHMVMGSIWVLMMVVVAGSSVFIQEIFSGSFSPIHLFVPVTAFGLYQGLMPLVRGQKGLHGRKMRGVFVGALILAGLFTFMPGRAMFNLFFGS
jgi:uncharacterized membrane protein